MTESGRGGVKTLAIRLPDELHAQLALIAQLEDTSLGALLLQSVQLLVEQRRSQPDFATRVEQALAEIEREAGARRNAIQGLIGKPATGTRTAGQGAGGEPRKGRAAQQGDQPGQ